MKENLEIAFQRSSIQENVERRIGYGTSKAVSIMTQKGFTLAVYA